MCLNADANSLANSVTVREVGWGDAGQIDELLACNKEGFDFILGADLLLH
jgi:hypothetical protein